MQMNPKEIPYKKYRVFFHALFWVVAIGMYTVVYGTNDGRYYQQLMVNLITLPVKMMATYSAVYILLPYFLLKRKYATFFPLLLVSAVVFSWLDWMVIYNFALNFYYKDKWGMMNYSLSFQIMKGIIHIYPIVIAASAIKIVKLWFSHMEQSKQLEKDKIEAELKFLKAQINPHFLFNTLNNLYALTLKKSDEAPKVVLKLSELLDYMLYECSANTVSLENEVKHLKNYIELERLRYGNRLTFEALFDGDFSHYTIAPMIILPFIENSFKHGASSSCLKPYIRLRVSIREGKLDVEISNNKGVTTSTRSTSEGIGMKNVKRRLELQYPGAYQLAVDNRQDQFTVKVTINLA